MPDLPAEVLLLTKLTHLRFYDGLDTMSRDLSPLEDLTVLDLSYGYFSSIPVMLSTCRRLEVLLMEQCIYLQITSDGTNALECLPLLERVSFDYE